MTSREHEPPPDAAAHRLAARRGQRLLDEQARRYALVLGRLEGARSLLDIGCGAGLLMEQAAARGLSVAGIDSNPRMIEEVMRRCPRAEILLCAARDISLPGQSFDAVTALQMLHEVLQTGGPAELDLVLRQMRRLLSAGGRLMLIDHMAPRDADAVVTIRLRPELERELWQMAERFRYRRLRVERAGEGLLRLSRRDLQDAITKLVWLDTPSQEAEMNETHCAIAGGDLLARVEAQGLAVEHFQPFESLAEDLAANGIELVDAAPWDRKFFLVARRTP